MCVKASFISKFPIGPEEIGGAFVREGKRTRFPRLRRGTFPASIADVQ